ncbi:MAG: phosphomannomutase/phosphoglucomutase [Alphaproteobacteria bacterium]|nr:phosphomannomutase/phosphoglucomutase [Alphaproteobacteria bacterium]
MNNHIFHPSILREYDIRGVFDETLFLEDAYWVGRIIGHIIRKNKGSSIAVGRDGRLSSPDLQSSLIKGLCEAGIDVYDIGISPTPLLYYAEHVLPVNGAIMVTGSHNPPTYNGFKISLNHRPFFGELIHSLPRYIRADLHKGKGKINKKIISSSYITQLLKDLKLDSSLSVVWDPGNGSTCEILKELVQKLPGTHLILNGEIDGTFPSHPPDPSQPNNLHELQKNVLTRKAHLGIAFDGDGDRMAAIDDKGHIFAGDQLLLIFACDLLKSYPHATIVVDIKTSQGVFDRINHSKGNALMWKTGHSHIKEKMRESGALLGGEMSGHFFFKEGYYGFDDGIKAALKLLQILEETKKSLSDYYNQLPHLFSSSEIRIPCPANRKFQIPLNIKEALSVQGASINDIDGIRIQSEEGWWLLRASNTQDALVARCEGYTKEGLENMKLQIKKALEKEEIFVDIN